MATGAQFNLDTPSRFPVHVVLEVTEPDGANDHYTNVGFYLLVGLSTAKVDELLEYRERPSQRLNDAERWELVQERWPGKMNAR